MTATNNAIVVQELRKHFGNKVVLSDLSFRLEPGVITVLLGPNGAGKSTCLSILSTQSKADGGSIDYPLKKPYSEAHCRQHMGTLFQKTALMTEATVTENLFFAGQLFGLSKTQCGEQIESGLERFDISDLALAPIQELSLGQRRIVDIIRVFLHSPSWVFLDEPTTGLDIKRRQLFWSYLHEYGVRQSAIVLCSTHIHEEIPENSPIITLRRQTAIVDEDDQWND